jgi:hypothetical protein
MGDAALSLNGLITSLRRTSFCISNGIVQLVALGGEGMHCTNKAAHNPVKVKLVSHLHGLLVGIIRFDWLHFLPFLFLFSFSSAALKLN